MSIAIWVAISIPFILGFAPVTAGGGRKVDGKQLEKLRSSVRLPLPDALRERVLVRLRSQERFTIGGAFIGMALAVIASIFMEPDDLNGALVIIGVGIGGGIGSVVGILRGARVAADDGTRVARTTAVTATDYVSTRSFLWARVMFGIGLAAVAVAVVLAVPLPFGVRDVLAVVVIPGVGVVICYLALEVLARSAAGSAQRAASELELAWDDALRSLGLRQVMLATVLTSAMAAVSMGVMVAGHPELWRTDAVLFVAAAVVATAGLVCGLVTLVMVVTEPRYRVLQRLWPRGEFDRA